MTNFNDEPISSPDRDFFDLDPFAQSIAKCVNNLHAPVGSVVAINGPWGSGKSSAVNLVQYHLKDSNSQLNIVRFECWIYRTEDALALGFLQELDVGLSPTLSKSVCLRKTFRELGTQVVGVGNALGVLAGATAGPLWGEIVKLISAFWGNWCKIEKGIDALQREVADALRESDQRFLVVIDDIDRLSPDEALVIFRLIKSVGRLPNVLYLLAYDREIVEKALTERYPSEGGPHYLEKIVQAGFELPKPSPAQLVDMLRAKIGEIFGEASNTDFGYFRTIFNEAVLPEIKTPRDVHRLANTLSVTYGAVKGEVNQADFLALETLRLFHLSTYLGIRANKERLVGMYIPQAIDEKMSQTYENALLKNVPSDDLLRLKAVLMTLFPRIEKAWSDSNHYVSYRNLQPAPGTQQRRVCSADHFDTYFRFTLSPYAIAQSEMDAIIRNASDLDFIRSQFLAAASMPQEEGRSKASFLLDEMKAQSALIAIEDAEPFLQAIYSIADDLCANDNENNILKTDAKRLFDLTNSLLLKRTELSQRSGILLKACKNASLEWLLHISSHLNHKDHDRSQNNEQRLMTTEHTNELKEHALSRIRTAAKDDTLLDVNNLTSALYRWRALADNEFSEVRDFCERSIKTDRGVVRFARACLNESLGRSEIEIGGVPNDLVEISVIEKFMNPQRFKERLDELVNEETLEQSDRDIIQRLIKEWPANP